LNGGVPPDVKIGAYDERFLSPSVVTCGIENVADGFAEFFKIDPHAALRSTIRW